MFQVCINGKIYTHHRHDHLKLHSHLLPSLLQVGWSPDHGFSVERMTTLASMHVPLESHNDGVMAIVPTER